MYSASQQRQGLPTLGEGEMSAFPSTTQWRHVGDGGKLHSFLASAPDKGEWSALFPLDVTLWKHLLFLLQEGGRASDQDLVWWRREKFLPLQGIELLSLNLRDFKIWGDSPSHLSSWILQSALLYTVPLIVCPFFYKSQCNSSHLR